ncbi:MAG: hypothetical protein WB421_17740 [Terriglobales bacterium]
MNAFVIKSWSASDQPDGNGNYVNINGRAGGLVSWLLNLLDISPTVSLIVSADKITFQKGSLEGSLHFITPLENTCTMFYAFKRPLKEAVVLGIVLGLATFFSFGLLGIAIAIIYYVLNKTLTIGFTDVGGRVSEIPFKRSVLEGKTIDEAEAARVCDIVQRLVDARQERTLSRVP